MHMEMSQSHHMAYLYNYIRKPYKTQERVHQILNEQYTNKPDGLSGNEDCGQMSAWYVLSAMGFYAVTPGLDYYAIGTPIFDEVTINLENGKQFKILANKVSGENKYIQSATLNGRELGLAVLGHQQILDGGELVFEMGAAPNKEWGVEMPVTFIDKKDEIVPVPFFTTASLTFKDKMEVGLSSVIKDAEIFYKTDAEFIKYELPFEINETLEIEAYTIINDKKSFTVKANYKKIIGDRSIEILSEYDNQYNAGGDKALIDNLKGSVNFRTGFWQGYYGKDVEVIIDLGKWQPIKKISIGALQDIKSWIWFPNEIELGVASSWNPKRPRIGFKELGSIKNEFPDNQYGAYTKEFVRTMNSPVNCRYLKIKVKNYGVCPSWHLGKGGDTWLFLDEITVE